MSAGNFLTSSRAFFTAASFLSEGKASYCVFTCLQNLTVRSLTERSFCKENDILRSPRATKVAAKRSHAALCPVTPNSVSQLLPCNKSNTTAQAVLLLVSFGLPLGLLSYNQREVRCFQPSSRREELRNLCAGFDSLQRAIS